MLSNVFVAKLGEEDSGVRCDLQCPGTTLLQGKVEPDFIAQTIASWEHLPEKRINVTFLRNNFDMLARYNRQLGNGALNYKLNWSFAHRHASMLTRASLASLGKLFARSLACAEAAVPRIILPLMP